MVSESHRHGPHRKPPAYCLSPPKEQAGISAFIGTCHTNAVVVHTYTPFRLGVNVGAASIDSLGLADKKMGASSDSAPEPTMGPEPGQSF